MFADLNSQSDHFPIKLTVYPLKRRCVASLMQIPDDHDQRAHQMRMRRANPSIHVRQLALQIRLIGKRVTIVLSGVRIAAADAIRIRQSIPSFICIPHCP